MSFSDQESPPLGSTTVAAMRINPVQIDLKGAVKKAISKNGSVQLTIQQLPLAVYREIAAHLQQLEGLRITITEQTSQDFDYLQSQVGGIELTFWDEPRDYFKDGGDRLIKILNHYAARFGPWEAT
ncbi:MAG: hypothetical protein ACFCBU_07320 [Cyanophyceae cyanobacterium]